MLLKEDRGKAVLRSEMAKKQQIFGPFPPRVLQNTAPYTGPNVPLVIIQQQSPS